MVKKIQFEVDIDVKGLGCKNGHGFDKKQSDNARELSKVFSGEDFSL